MEGESKQRSQRNRRRERAQEMKQQQQQRQNQQQNNAGSGEEDDEDNPPPPRGRERTRHRPKRRKSSRSSSGNDEDIIDGFAITSFSSLDALENEGKTKGKQKSRTSKHLEDSTNTDRGRSKWHGRKKTRDPHRANHCRASGDENALPQNARSNSDRLSDGSSHSQSGSGYMCDSESDQDTHASETGSDLFTTANAINRSYLEFCSSFIFHSKEVEFCQI
eukprot:XP_011670267.1 PREDICTED: autism susceptibility gene 2 protein-like [Strongylocentrotus purpuratus]